MLNATVIERKEVTQELIILKVKPDAPIPDFQSGQYVAVGLLGSAPRAHYALPEKEAAAPDKLIKRAYSVGSAPTEKDFLELYVAIVPDGALTPRLYPLKAGDRIHVAPKITGTFTLAGVPDDQNLILISTGTGIAPFVSMLRTQSTWKPGRKITIIHGVRFSKDLGYRDELLKLQAQRPDSLKYHAIVSRTDPEWNGPKGRIHNLFNDGTVSFNQDKDHVFLCGNPAMIDEVVTMLEGQGFTEHSKKNPAGKLHVERYW